MKYSTVPVHPHNTSGIYDFYRGYLGQVSSLPERSLESQIELSVMRENRQVFLMGKTVPADWGTVTS